ncbi:hypothetical protein [Streptomyces sp. NPDC050287]|uniref:hypothetical protein n=1 Tax=Streptomyces sp. NPDC050287 TaxID=3365608 RepID=UPI00379DC61E
MMDPTGRQLSPERLQQIRQLVEESRRRRAALYRFRSRRGAVAERGSTLEAGRSRGGPCVSACTARDEPNDAMPTAPVNGIVGTKARHDELHSAHR